MLAKIQSFLFFILLIPNLYSESFSIMNLNAQNLFDTLDDVDKDDKAFLPIENKESFEHINACHNINVKAWRMECLYLDWNEDTKNAKLANLVKNIISYDNAGADIIALQEVENNNILEQLYILLKPYGYIDYVLVEGTDKRGIDNAFISKFEMSDPKLHYVKFSPQFEKKDTRPILEASIFFNNKKIRIYNVHFPSNFNDLQMRIESFNLLKELHLFHSDASIALGDFNLNSKDDLKEGIYKNQEDQWYVAHREGCLSCKGSYYYSYGKSWDFLDTIFVSRDRGIYFDKDSINVLKTDFNTYKDSGKPHRFDPKTKKGVSDHFPMVSRINLN